MKNLLKTLTIVFIAQLLTSITWGQTSIPTESAYTQNFDIGNLKKALLPTNWKVDINSIAVRQVGTYALAETTTAHRAGINMSPTANNGIY